LALTRKTCQVSLVASVAARVKRAVIGSDLASVAKTLAFLRMAVSARTRATAGRDVMDATWAFL
jgi:hypothetical protein